jgi:dolichyl-phosphate-mannose--protein O-mannosyl transferase
VNAKQLVSQARENTGILAIFIFVLLALQLALSIRRQSQSFDEGAHLYAGYAYWKHDDFGKNPEHPLLVKLLSALPLLPMHLRQPVDRNRYFKTESFLDGRDFLYRNHADAMLFRARMAASLLTLLLALLIFFSTRELFGTGAALLAMLLMCFEPNFLAHGAQVTTDIGVTVGIFAAVYLFYRYSCAPSWLRLIAVGLATGLEAKLNTPR